MLLLIRRIILLYFECRLCELSPRRKENLKTKEILGSWKVFGSKNWFWFFFFKFEEKKEISHKRYEGFRIKISWANIVFGDQKIGWKILNESSFWSFWFCGKKKKFAKKKPNFKTKFFKEHCN